MSGFFKMIVEGGVFFTVPILVLIVLMLVLAFMAYRDTTQKEVNLKRIASISVFALSLGVLGQVVGLMQGFKIIEEVGEIAPKILVAGLRISSISTFFGLTVFLIGRLVILVLGWKGK